MTGKYVEKINNELVKLTDSWHSGEQDEIYEAMKYYLVAPGKRIRPMLTLVFGEIFGVPEDEIMPFALALEMIHAYSLIHDDLPCMDNDDMRRGRPTCHKVFGEGMAVLAGDALLNKAFETMLGGTSKNRAEAAFAVGTLSGTSGMIGGQVIDLSGKDSKEAILKMYELKTSALLECPAEIAIALSGCKDTQKCEAARNYTKYLGLAFQIKDDLLDVYGDSAVLGKNTGSDEKQEKNTVLHVCGKENAEKMVSEYTEIAIKSCDVFTVNGDFLKKFAEEMLARNK